MTTIYVVYTKEANADSYDWSGDFLSASEAFKECQTIRSLRDVQTKVTKLEIRR